MRVHDLIALLALADPDAEVCLLDADARMDADDRLFPAHVEPYLRRARADLVVLVADLEIERITEDLDEPDEFPPLTLRSVP